jgi:hypothetical protein
MSSIVRTGCDSAFLDSLAARPGALVGSNASGRTLDAPATRRFHPARSRRQPPSDSRIQLMDLDISSPRSASMRERKASTAITRSVPPFWRAIARCTG